MLDSLLSLKVQDYSLDPFFDLSPHLKCVATREGTILHVNPAFADITGYSEEKATGTLVFDLAEPDGRKEMEENWKMATASGEPVQFHSRIRRADEGRARLDWHVAAQGELIYAVARDLTKREMAEERFKLVVNHAPNGVVVVEASGAIVLVNAKAESLFGYDEGEMIGLRVENLVPERLRGGHEGHRNSFHSAPAARSMGTGRELYGMRKDGKEFPLEIGLTPISSEEGPLVLAVVVDITERRRLESEVLEISEREQRRIGRDIHDDICQQLAGIGCLVSLATDQLEKSGAEQTEMLGEISRLVSETNTRARDLSRGLVSGGIESEGLVVALEGLAAGSERLFNIRCEVSAGDGAETGCEKKRVQLYRIAQEAISNAVRHGKASRIRISVDHDGDRLVMTVKDNGSSFDGAPETGDGIGLLGMARRAQMMNGRLEVTGESGEGTTIRCSIPRGE